MRRLFRLAALGLGLLLAVFVAGALWIGPAWSLRVTRDIDASPERVFPWLNTLSRWPDWSAWSPQSHPGMTIEHEGSERGVGAIQRWSDAGMEGRLEILGSAPPRTVVYEVVMDPGSVRIDGQLSLEPVGSGTRVEWSAWGNSGNDLAQRWTMLFLRPAIREDFETGLAKLARLVEAEP